MKTINDKINDINAIRERIAEIDNAIDNASSIRDFDEHNAEKSVALSDLEIAVAELQQSIAIAKQIQDDSMSKNAHKRVTAMYVARCLTKTAERGIVIK